MEQDDDIDFLLTLNKHGWSTGYLFIRDELVEFTITHIFGDPYYDLMSALSDMISKRESASFFWYGEPGGERIEFLRIKDRQQMVQVVVNGFSEVFDEEPKAYEPTISFEISLKQLVTLFYFQLKKTSELLSDTAFAKQRHKDFPFTKFHVFEQLAVSFLELK